MENSDKNIEFKKIKILSISYFSINFILLISFIVFGSFFKIWKHENFLIAISLFSISVNFFQSIILLALKYSRDNGVPKGKKAIEYILFYFNKEKIENIKVLTNRGKFLLKSAIITLVFIMISIITMIMIFVLLGISGSDKEENYFIVFLLIIFLYFLVLVFLILKKICHVYIGKSEKKKKTDFIFFFLL
ncbi:hypothetical protein [Mesomycoplasma molare]|uniref:Uncharacterized protein n=1 Tax=Mesomycoplasma molare TaxID=171288 RepID=A0ABY5TXY1_9BACT|nr:hypothetical protein [Mesomycoplasma molare]UWD34371.1 hypothetical protein NX772_00890 [Mesomycoplasma molare]